MVVYWLTQYSASNFGGTIPKFPVLKMIDWFTSATCIPPSSPPKDLKGELITQAFNCALEPEKQRCLAGGGVCNVQWDGKP